MKKYIRKNLFIIISCLSIICINNILYSKYLLKVETVGKASIAKSIVILEDNETINKKVDRTSFPIEYYFAINNYDNKNNINEVDFYYTITIENSNDNFPINYILYDCDNNREIKLDNNTSEILKINKNIKTSRKFKVILNWKDINKELSNNTEIILKVNVIQFKEENSG